MTKKELLRKTKEIVDSAEVQKNALRLVELINKEVVKSGAFFVHYPVFWSSKEKLDELVDKAIESKNYSRTLYSPKKWWFENLYERALHESKRLANFVSQYQ